MDATNLWGTVMKDITDSAKRDVVTAVEELSPELQSFVGDLVSERSVLGDEAGAQALVRERLTKMGFNVEELNANEVDGIREHPEFSDTGLSYEDRSNIVAERPGTGNGRNLVFNGHVDIVPEGDRDKWSFDPFAGEVEDGNLLGRGASDMKGGVGAMLFAIAALDQAGIQLQGDLAVETVIEEEAGGFGGSLATALAGPASSGDYDAVVIPEPTDFNIWMANDGVSYFRVIVDGKAAHAAKTDDGVNAAAKMYPIFQALSELHDKRKTSVTDELMEKCHEHTVSLNLGSLQAGEWPSSVPERATLEARISHAPAENRDEIHDIVEQTVAEAAAGDSWLEDHPPTVEWFGWRGSSAKVDTSEPIITAAQDVMTTFGEESVPQGFTGGIDSRFYVNYADTPAICFGPGDHNIHSTDECLPIDELERITKALAFLAMEWCGYEVVE